MAWVTRIAFVLVAGLVASGCGGLILEQARKTAALDHDCPLAEVTLERNAGHGGSYAYWLNVCGRSRFYLYEEVSTAGFPSGRFLDKTRSMD